MAICGKLRIKEGNNREYVHNAKHRLLKAIRKIFIVYKAVTEMQGIA
jgi:hypothetical protein